jgi:hypothetical protein
VIPWGGASKWKKPICLAADKAKKIKTAFKQAWAVFSFCFALSGWAFSSLAVRGGFGSMAAFVSVSAKIRPVVRPGFCVVSCLAAEAVAEPEQTDY